TPANKETSASTQVKGEKVIQKMYDLTQEEILEIVKDFKGIDQAAQPYSRLMDDDSLELDSSIFVVEAALNFDYDYNGEELYERSVEQFQVDLPVTNGKVSNDDLESVYAT